MPRENKSLPLEGQKKKDNCQRFGDIIRLLYILSLRGTIFDSIFMKQWRDTQNSINLPNLISFLFQ